MTAQNAPVSETLKEQPFVSHLLELRDRLLRAVIAVGLIFLCLFPFSNDIYVAVAGPLMANLPEGATMIATGVITPFLTPFKLTLMMAMYIGMPFILYQLWSFIAPGLYKHEKRLMIPLVGSSALLFYVGMLFAYYVVFPLIFKFMAATTPEGVMMAPDIAEYLDLVLTLFFAFGLAFEVPIATIILVSMGMTTPDKLIEKRPYIIVGAFCLGMVLTPPDVISQTLLALPMWVLFEIGVFASRSIYKGKQQREAAEEGGTDTSAAPAMATAGAADATVADSVDVTDPGDLDRFVPLSEDELDAELDLIEAAEASDEDEDEDEDETEDLGESDSDDLYQETVQIKLQQVTWLRDQGEVAEARALLYEILGEGDDDQVMVARNILAQMDEE